MRNWIKFHFLWEYRTSEGRVYLLVLFGVFIFHYARNARFPWMWSDSYDQVSIGLLPFRVNPYQSIHPGWKIVYRYHADQQNALPIEGARTRVN